MFLEYNYLRYDNTFIANFWTCIVPSDWFSQIQSHISPESLICNPVFRNMIIPPSYREKMVALVVDEIYCVKIW